MNRKSSYTPLRQLINFTINTGGNIKQQISTQCCHLQILIRELDVLH